MAQGWDDVELTSKKGWQVGAMFEEVLHEGRSD